MAALPPDDDIDISEAGKELEPLLLVTMENGKRCKGSKKVYYFHSNSKPNQFSMLVCKPSLGAWLVLPFMILINQKISIRN